MKRKLLLSLCTLAVCIAAQAQKKAQRTTAYAITGAEKGSHRWMEVNLVDVTTGEVIAPVYQSKSEVKRLNARTGQPIVLSPKTETTTPVEEQQVRRRIQVQQVTEEEGIRVVRKAPVQAEGSSTVTLRDANGQVTTIRARRILVQGSAANKEVPFATNSAACAWDAKHKRLYYTPMGINQLRYIDLRAKEPSVCYFEGEAFGTVSGNGDVTNQITRMAIAADGNGYALTNDAQQLIQFTTKKKPVITNLGAVTDDASNGKFSVNSRSAYGGDLIADDRDNLYLITANRRVYRISLETRVATYLGSIKGLPEGYTTNGAVAEGGSSIIVTSSSSTQGYYRFDLENLNAEKITTATVFNASDLANERLLSLKKKKEETPVPVAEQEVLAAEQKTAGAVEKSIGVEKPGIASLSVFPNPVTNGSTRLSFSNYPEGRYDLQLYDLAGKLVSRRAIQVNNEVQIVDYKLPESLAKGTYFLQILSASKGINASEKIIVQ
jgi:hypothetical protein